MLRASQQREQVELGLVSPPGGAASFGLVDRIFEFGAAEFAAEMERSFSTPLSLVVEAGWTRRDHPRFFRTAQAKAGERPATGHSPASQFESTRHEAESTKRSI